MKCSNEYCIFNAFEQCCHESEEGHANATPDRLDCPSSVRSDIQHQIHEMFADCTELLVKRNLSELIEIKRFIIAQRKE